MNAELNVDLKGIHYFPHLLPNYRRLAVIDCLTAARKRNTKPDTCHAHTEFLKRSPPKRLAPNEKVSRSHTERTPIAG